MKIAIVGLGGTGSAALRHLARSVDLIINNVTLKTCLPSRTSIYNQTGQILVGENLQNYYWKFRLNRQHSTDLFLDQQKKRLYVTETDRVIMFDINFLEQGFFILGESSDRWPNLKEMRSSFIDFDDNLFEITGFDGIAILNSSIKFEAMAYDETNGDIYVLNIKRNNIIKYTIEREVTLYNNTVNSFDNETDITQCEIASDSTWMPTGEVILGNTALGCGSAKEQLCLPTQLFITSDDILYILDSGNLRIQKYNLTDKTVSTAISRGLIFIPLSIYFGTITTTIKMERF
ncbi:unnamed protein product [Rotaria sordida]|uniref:Uncharacterized protein n=2 Tax=Rotaria sordida TaxID=392033 RepID=A0A814BHR9_9BILA|nr:unnamed protein product [Rotaria sordida]